MNPFIQIKCETKITKEKLISEDQFVCDNHQYSAIVCGFQNFKEAMVLNQRARKIGASFYCLNSSGLQGFFFADVGQKLEFSHLNKLTNLEEQHCIDNSMALSDYLQTLLSPTHKFNWNRREAARPYKHLLLSIGAQYLKELDANASTDMLSLASSKGVNYNSD